MGKIKTVTVVSVLLLVNSAFADVPSEDNSKIISALQVRKAIGLLIQAGVLDVENSELVVKEPSILEQLDQQGRVNDGKIHPSAICSK